METKFKLQLIRNGFEITDIGAGENIETIVSYDTYKAIVNLWLHKTNYIERYNNYDFGLNYCVNNILGQIKKSNLVVNIPFINCDYSLESKLNCI